MPTADKAKTIEQAKDWYAKSVGVVFTDYRGLKVKDVQQLRRDLRKKGAEIHVLKNTLFRIAAGDDVSNIPDEMHNGPTAVAFVFENETDCAKALFDYARTNKNLKVKGGFFGGRAMNAKEVEAFSALPPRDVLIAQVIGAIAAPLTTLIGTIEALYADPIRVIGAVADKVAESSPAPAPAPKAEAAPAPEPAAEAAPATQEGATAEAAHEPGAATEGAPSEAATETSETPNSTEAVEASPDPEAPTE